MALSSPDLVTLSRLLDESMDLEPAQLQAWLAGLAQEHGHLRPRLVEMLAARAGQGDSGFLAEGPKLAGRTDDTVARVGDVIGPYRLIREIGEGGMGVVWLAERIDGSLKRQVALKLPRLTWGAGMAERMARERDIDALLEHANIARLYDAGVDSLGRPYLALEYIDGQPLDEWCSAKALSIPDRLRLFLQVIRAVAYAHGRLVVHRDLKPSNVLVTEDGQAHLLDFGIAKLLHDSVSADDRLTQAGGRVLSPHYASPEQIRGDPITVASDVYSLGVLLYELLAGAPPYAPARKSLGALEEAILAGEPPPASGRAKDRPTAKALRGELDSILGKALRREPSLRYATADALAQDIDRYLKGERVLAQPDSLGYRARKALRRNKAVFAAGGAVLVAVLGGAGVSIVQATKASDAAERARVVKEFVVDVFKVNERGTAGNQELRQLPAELLLERGAKLIETKFPGQPQLQAELFGVVGGIFADMGANALAADYATHQVEVLVAIKSSDEEQAKATILLTQALLAEGRIGDARVRAQRALELAESSDELRPVALILLARVLDRQGDIKEAGRLLDRADVDLRKSHAPSAVAARSTALRASWLRSANRFDEAIPLYRSAIDTALAAEGPLSPTAIDIRLVLQRLFIVHDRGDESKPYREAALAALRAIGAAGEIRAALVESESASLMFSISPKQMSFEEAREAVERNRSLLASRGPLVPAVIRASLDRDLGLIYLEWGNLALAEPLLVQSFAVLAPLASQSLSPQWRLVATQGMLEVFLGQHGDAAIHASKAIELGNRSRGQHPDAVIDYRWAAFNLVMQRKFDEAEALLASAPAVNELQGGGVGSSGYSLWIQRSLAAVKLARGDAPGAFKLLPPESDDGPPLPMLDDTQVRGEILCAMGNRIEGLERLERVLKVSESLEYAYHPALAHARSVTGLCALAAGQRSRAVELARQAREAFTAQPGVSDYFKLPLNELERRLQSKS
jgi:tetratricopeptide (TPR) repeat protein